MVAVPSQSPTYRERVEVQPPAIMRVMAMAAPALRTLALDMGLTDHEYDLICAALGREPTETELGMYGVMWSEHCGYKYSRPVLAYFAQYRAAQEAGGMENAGVVELEPGLGITFKVESHNHPSAVEPYQGAATGVGGILRDVFTMGARPIALLNSLRFGPTEPGPHTDDETAARNRWLLDHVVRGIGGYGNCVGVPTVGGEVSFHWTYSGNPLVNAMAVGLVRTDQITTAAARGIGNAVIYLGSSTGKDGIHGASFASQVLDEESEAKRPNVQIGDPFAEKLLIEATLEALATGAVEAIQDMGAAGLTCSTIEMSAKGRVGMEIDLDLVPAREENMTATELMLSESQERMLCTAKPGREQEIIKVFEKWGLPARIIGYVIEQQVVRIKRNGKIEAELFPPHLADECPTYAMVPQAPPYADRVARWSPDTVPVVADANALLRLLSHPNVASKRAVFQQYDFEVQTQTAMGPLEADAAVLAPRGTDRGISVTIDGNGRWQYFDPYAGGVAAVCEAARNVACTGARPAGVTDGLNFGNPQDPHVFWQFERVVKGIADAAHTLGTPVVSGNVSFYNEAIPEPGATKTAVLPTAMIGMVGVLDWATNAVPSSVHEAGLGLAIVRCHSESRHEGIGASLYLEAIHGIEDGLPCMPNPASEKQLAEFLVQGARRGLLRAAHDVSEGGLAVTLAEMVIPTGMGMEVTLDGAKLPSSRLDGMLFGEFPGHVVIAYDPKNLSNLMEISADNGLDLFEIGGTKESKFVVFHDGKTVIRLLTAELQGAFEGVFASILR